jgi:Glycosyl transferase family 11
MIIARITMGLGNQMFQYAAAKALSLEKNTPLKLDVSSYQAYTLRRYELDSFFGIKADIATVDELQKYFYKHPLKRVWNRLRPKRKLRTLGLPYEEPLLARKLLAAHDFFLPPHKRKTYLEPHYHFDTDFFKATDDIYLQGYWMSWRYFHNYENVIKQEFTMKQTFEHLPADLIAEIKGQNSISLHIRRTDITNPVIVKMKGLVPLDYYYNAADYLKSKIENPVYYIFSDDIQWARQHLNIKDAPVHFITDIITHTHEEDFYLMQQCKHNVIVNSTFSWWAAYLSPINNKIVIAPKRWYNNTDYNYKDVYPLSWIQIDW